MNGSTGAFVIQNVAEPVPSFPRLLKIYVARTRIAFNVEPEDYLGAIAELLFLTICLSYCITKVWDPDLLEDNPIINMVGYNNPCAFWDNPPALYFAAIMFCPMVHFAFRYASLDSARARLALSSSSFHFRLCRSVNTLYATSQMLLMGIFVITPLHAKHNPDEKPEVLHNHMRLHSFCFLQFVPVLCITMTSNYVEGFWEGTKKSKPSCWAWCVLFVYVLSSTLEAVFASYAIFSYEGPYLREGREKFFKVDPTLMQTIDYIWFFSLPIAAACQPRAPNLLFHYDLESSDRATHRSSAGRAADDLELYSPGDDFLNDHHIADTDFHHDKQCICLLILLAVLVPPALAGVELYEGPDSKGHTIAWIAAGMTPLAAICILLGPMVNNVDSSPYPSTFFGFTLNGAYFGFGNYYSKMMSFAKKAGSKDWRNNYATWFEDQTAEDPSVGVKFGGNTQMFYSWEVCVEKLQSMGSNIQAGSLKRESELALGVLNNTMYHEAGKFGLGMTKKMHADVRPWLVSMFDGAQDQEGGWTKESLRTEFRVLFAELTLLDHNPVTRVLFDILSPTRSKTIVTHMVLKVLHKVCLNMEITDKQAVELSALQYSHLTPGFCPARVARSFAFWSCLAGPARTKGKKWIARYKVALRAKFGEEQFSRAQLKHLASAFFDGMLQAGGRSVPVAIDLVMGYMHSENKPACLEGVDFSDAANVRSLMLEAMRFHPPVTVVPTWVKQEESGADGGSEAVEQDEEEVWSHELICLDRALADPQVFPEPNEFQFRRDNEESCSMAWAAEATVDGDLAHPDSHACPGRQLSIAITEAFVLEFLAAGPWSFEKTDIKFNFYGTKGWKASKNE